MKHWNIEHVVQIWRPWNTETLKYCDIVFYLEMSDSETLAL